MSWFSRLIQAWRDRPDPAWKPTGVRPLTEWSYDEAQAVKSARKAKRRTATGRAIPQPRQVKDNVTPIRRLG